MSHPSHRICCLALIGAIQLFGLLFASEAMAQQRKPNVLFIAVDDLNHWVGHFGRNKQTKTPNIDRLARMGVTFTNAHCAAPICNPSRTALLSGLRPSTTGVYDNSDPFVKAVTSEQSLVTQFKKAGYETLGMGKLWHGGLGFPDQWSGTGGPERGGAEKAKLDDRSIAGIKFGVLDGDDDAVSDTQIANYGIEQLNKTHDKPFFLTVGFHKPHMPWNVPKKYYDMHPLDQIELPPTQPNDLTDLPAAAVKIAHSSGDHAAVLASGRWKEAVQAYLAAISYLDGQVGRVLDALEKSAHASNTIICFWGDHGWHLGEKEHWRKFALWEEATRAPFIWVAPGTTNRGGVCERPVDFMSIYPTLCDLTGLAIPAHVEGKSIRKLLTNPNSEWNGVGQTTFGLNNHAVRTDKWRYIRYADGSEELYDHTKDQYEWTNLASRSEYQQLKAELAKYFPTTNARPVKLDENTDENKPDNNERKIRRQQRQDKAVSFLDKKAANVDDQSKSRPNIVWMIVEDMSANYACYGETSITTPNVDRLAERGTRFSKAFVTAPICSICRSALITGRYQTSIGAQNHRSSVPGHTIQLPSGVELVPAVFRKSGYHTNNLTVEAFTRSDEEISKSPSVKVAKTDYNFEWEPSQTYDDMHWATREKGKPFFVQVQLHGGKHRGQGTSTKWPEKVKKDLGSITSTDQVRLPPYLPNDPTILEDWAQYLDTVRYTDWEVGRVVQRLQEAGELENTVIFFMTDHGISHVRNKQFLYDGGTHIPMIVCGPGVPGGKVRHDVVEHIDFGATSLALAGIQKPESMFSKDLLAENYEPRQYVFAARDRADETVDLIRSVRDSRWKYIYNGFPNRPYLQPNNYKDGKPIVQAMRRLHSEGKLNSAQSLIMAETRPREELYDTQSDPFELHNLAGDSVHSPRLASMRTALVQWQQRTGDKAETETEEVYRAEVSTDHAEGAKKKGNVQYHANVELMLRWMKERPLVK